MEKKEKIVIKIRLRDFIHPLAFLLAIVVILVGVKLIIWILSRFA